MKNEAIFKISYGLYVLTAREKGRDNGCIINTAQLVTDNPLQISITVNKESLTHDMILNTGLFNVNILDVDAPQSIFEKFGYVSGKDEDKFGDCDSVDNYSKNGIRYLKNYINAYISARVTKTVDVGTHTIFIAEITDAVEISQKESLTYEYYQKNIKPTPKAENGKGTKWVCKVCGYVYEGENLPKDFVCPWCKHGAIDFEKVN